MKIQSLCTDDCIDEVIEKYSATVYRLAYSRLQSKSDADDVFQEVFLRYISKARTFASEEHRKAWLIRVTINCCKKLWSSAWFKKTVPLEDTITFEMPEESGLSETIAALPPKYRTVIHLFYYEELKITDICKATGLGENTVKSRLHRARNLLREKLREVGLNEFE